MVIKKAIYNFFLLLFFFHLFSSEAFCQVISGFIVDENKQPVSFANISLLDSENRILKGTISNDSGYFKIYITDQATKLYVSHLNYDEHVISTDSLRSLKSPSILILHFKSYSLNEISISENRIGVKIDNDTVKYNIKSFMDGSEKNLKNIIEKLPGMEINKTGSASFMGEKIDKILIDGDEFFNAQHNIAFNNISSEVVQNIEIIHNYNPEFNFDSTKRLALNILTNKNITKRAFGKTESGAGIISKYFLTGNLFKFDQNLKFNLNHNSNNTGFQSFGVEDYLLSTGFIDNVIREGESVDMPVIPSFLIDENLANSGADNLTTLNAKFNTDKLKIDGFSILKHAKFNKDFKTTFIYNDLFNLEKQSNNSETTLFSVSQIKMHLFINEKISIISKSEFNKTKSKRAYMDNNYLNRLYKQSFNNDDTPDELSIKTHIEVLYKINHKQNIIFKYHYNLQNNSNISFFKSNLPFHDAIFNNNSGNYEAKQNNTFFDNENKATITYTNNLSQNIKFESGCDFLHDQFENEVLNNSDSFRNDHNLIEVSNLSVLKINLNKIRIKLGNKILLHYQDKSLTKSDFFPFFKVDYSINKRNKIGWYSEKNYEKLNNENFEYYELLQLSNIKYIFNYPLGKYPEIISLNFDYKYINTFNQIFSYLKTSVFYNKNKYGFMIDGVEKSVFKNAQDGKGIIAIGSFRKKNKKNDLSLHFMYKAESLYFNENYFSSSYSSTLSGNFSLKLNKRFIYILSTQLKSDKNITNNVSEIQGIYTSCSNSIQYSIKFFKLKLEYFYSFDKVDFSLYHKNLLNIDFRYDLKNIPIYFDFECKNIFNIKKYNQVFEKNANGINQIIEFQTYPGYIILKLGLTF